MSEPQVAILLVDDDEQVLMVIEMQLQSLGHRVVAMQSARNALARFQADPDAFDLIVTDGLMPDILGAQLAQALMRIRPKIPVILCTGFSPNCTPEMARSVGCRAFVAKPMSVTDWSAVISHVLSRSDFYSKD